MYYTSVSHMCTCVYTHVYSPKVHTFCLNISQACIHVDVYMLMICIRTCIYVHIYIATTHHVELSARKAAWNPAGVGPVH